MSKPDDVILEEVGSTEDAIRHCNADEAMKVSACSLDDAKDPPDVKDTTDDELEDILNDDPPDFCKEDATVLDTLLDLTDMRRNSLGSRDARRNSLGSRRSSVASTASRQSDGRRGSITSCSTVSSGRRCSLDLRGRGSRAGVSCLLGGRSVLGCVEADFCNKMFML